MKINFYQLKQNRFYYSDTYWWNLFVTEEQVNNSFFFELGNRYQLLMRTNFLVLEPPKKFIDNINLKMVCAKIMTKNNIGWIVSQQEDAYTNDFVKIK